MNTQKYKVGNLGLLSEADRTMYDKKDTISKSIIDKERTHQNYNLCPHPQYIAAEVRKINEKIRGKALAKNAIAWGSTIVTVPQDYGGNLQDFFAESYKGLKKMYKLKDEDIISAYVHMDETTPHMHFYFIPVKHDAERDRINWDGVMPRKMYQQQHRVLQKYLSERLGEDVHLLNGATKGIDCQNMTSEEKRLSMRIEKLKASVGDLRKRESAIKMAGDRLLAGIDSMVKAHDGLRRALNVSWKLPDNVKDKIVEMQDKTDVKVEEALKKPMDSVEAILAAADEAERATRAYSKLKAAAKGEVDDLLEDDDFER